MAETLYERDFQMWLEKTIQQLQDRDFAALDLEKLVEELIELGKGNSIFDDRSLHSPVARDLMSSPVRTIRPETTIEQAGRILFRYGHSGLSVVDETDRLVGIVSRRDLDLALHHGFSHVPVRNYMTRNPKTIAPDTPLSDIEALMVIYDLGRLPVVEDDRPIGIVTRTDVLRQLYREREKKTESEGQSPLRSCLLPSMRERLEPMLWNFLEQAAAAAQEKGWHLYLVGGAVRDLLLAAQTDTLLLQDVDLVVDGFHRSADVGAGVELANRLREIYPQAKLSIHGEFQTAVLWHEDPQLGSLWVDIATARTEFYPYPAANPEIEASSIRQDLYRRDFTINALAVRLTSPSEGELLDYFGGVSDLRSRQIRVLHANSFIEDPTRIFRAVRFAVRLGFEIEALTESYIRFAIASGIYDRLREANHPAPALTTRLRAELKYILAAPYWKNAIRLLDDLEALKCLHSDLVLTDALGWQLRYLSRTLKILDPQSHLEHWLMRLEVLIASLDERVQIADYLFLPKDSIDRLGQLEEAETEIRGHLAHSLKRSEVVLCLRRYKLPMLMLVASRSDRPLRRLLWSHTTRWSKTQPPIDGNDLKVMGYKPGPQYKQILDALLCATLDGEIGDRRSAEDFVRLNYPSERRSADSSK